MLAWSERGDFVVRNTVEIVLVDVLVVRFGGGGGASRVNESAVVSVLLVSSEFGSVARWRDE